MNKERKNKHLTIILCALLVLVTLAAFEQVRNNDFINFDDGKYIVKNVHVNTGLTLKNINWAFTTGYASNWHPLTWITHMIDCELFAIQPAGHHIMNLAFHLINTLLLFTILTRMTGSLWASAFTAALFALHPVHVESVAWASERKDTLSAMFWLLTMWAYLWHSARPNALRYLIVLAAFSLGLMSKPMVVTLPFVLLLLDYWPLNRTRLTPEKSNIPKQSLRFLIFEKVPLLAAAAISCIITYLVQQHGGAVAVVHKWPLTIRLSNAFVAYMGYIAKTFYPTRLSLLYPLPLKGLPLWQAAVSALIIILITAAVVYYSRKKRYLIVGWLWYVGTLVPVIGLVQVGMQAMADRYMYIPSIGLYIMIVWGAADLLKKIPFNKVLAGFAAAAVCIILIICTRTQVRHWRNDLAIFGHSARVTKDNFIMHNKYGGVLGEMGRFEESLRHCNEALRISPDFYKAHNNIAATYLKQEKIKDAIPYLKKALELKPDLTEARNNLGVVYLKMGRINDAILCFREVLKIDPKNKGAKNNLQIAQQQQQYMTEMLNRQLNQ